MLDGGFFLPLPINKPPDFGSAIIRGLLQDDFRRELKLALFTRSVCLDGGFFLPLPVNKPPDFSGVIMGGYYKVISVGTEAGAVQTVSMLDGGFFLPLHANKPPDFSDMIMGGCHKVISVGAEAGFQLVKMPNGYYILAEKNFRSSQYFGNGKE